MQFTTAVTFRALLHTHWRGSSRTAWSPTPATMPICRCLLNPWLRAWFCWRLFLSKGSSSFLLSPTGIVWLLEISLEYFVGFLPCNIQPLEGTAEIKLNWKDRATRLAATWLKNLILKYIPFKTIIICHSVFNNYTCFFPSFSEGSHLLRRLLFPCQWSYSFRLSVFSSPLWETIGSRKYRKWTDKTNWPRFT